MASKQKGKQTKISVEPLPENISDSRPLFSESLDCLLNLPVAACLMPLTVALMSFLKKASLHIIR